MSTPSITLRPDGRQREPIQRALDAIYDGLVTAIRDSAQRHDVGISPSAARRMAADITPLVVRLPYTRTPAAADKSQVALRPREIQAVMGLARGLSARQTGYRLGLSEDTVKTHLRRAYAALGARNGSHAVAICLKYGLLRPEDIADV